MSGLSAAARAAVEAAGLTVQQYVEAACGSPWWRGDACGCPDDRCAGYHHEAGADCPCLRYTLQVLAAQRRGGDR